ncbi:MAG: DUF1674 domain-containing protein [Rhodomicrobiaceae bacterium]
MTDGKDKQASAQKRPDAAPGSTPAARALAEAKQRRRKAADAAISLPTELGGRDGPEPTRYGDWEKRGIASDF